MIKDNKVAIYKLECLANGRVYIGKTKRPADRKMQHFYALRGGKHAVKLMQSDYEKYGESSFAFTVLDVVDREAVEIGLHEDKFTDAIREKELMEQYKSYLPEWGYNYGDNYFRHVSKRNGAADGASDLAHEKKKQNITVEDLRNIAEAKMLLIKAAKKLKGLWKARWVEKKILSAARYLDSLSLEYRHALWREEFKNESNAEKETA